MKEILQITNLLEKQFDRISSDYELLKGENIELLEALEISESKNSRLQKLLEKEQEKFDVLKVSKTLYGSSGDVKETEHKIDALVSQIDLCIDKLSQ